MDTPSPLEGIDQATLTPVVRRVLGSDTAEAAEWHCHSLSRPLASTTEGIYRLYGTARDRGVVRPWSVVLKISRPASAGSIDEEAERELLAYQSGLLKDVSGRLRAPRCLGNAERPDGYAWLWLEEVKDAYGGSWPLSRYGLAARHLGEFNGAYLESRPGGRRWQSESWLSRHWLRGWVAGHARLFERYPAVLDDPFARRIWSEDLAAGTLRLFAEREVYLDALERLPQTFCHLEASKKNLLARQMADGTEQTVAIDWTCSGMAPLGQEIAPTVASSVGFYQFDLGRVEELQDVVFEGYLAGLRDAGWHGDPRVVRFGYAAASALRYELICLPVLACDRKSRAGLERSFGRPIEEVCEHWATLQRHLLGLADEARELLPLVE